MKNICFLFLFIISWYFPLAQNNTADSLRIVLQTLKEDTNKVNTLNLLSRALLSSDSKNAREAAEKAVLLSEKLNFKKGKGLALINIGRVCWFLNQGDTALMYLQDALKILEESKFAPGIVNAYNNIGLVFTENFNNYQEARKNQLLALGLAQKTGDKIGVANSHYQIGYIYASQSNYPEALKHYYIALREFEDLGDPIRIAAVLQAIADINISQNNHSEAKSNYFKALAIYKKSGNKFGVAQISNAISEEYLLQEKFDEAFKNAAAALVIFKEVNATANASYSYSIIGRIYEKEAMNAYEKGEMKEYNNKLNEALNSHLTALKLNEATENKSVIAQNCLDIGNIKIRQKKYSEVNSYLEKARRICKTIGAAEILSKVYLSYSVLDSIQKDYSKEITDYKMYVGLRDSIFNDVSTKQFVQAQMNYEFDKKESLVKAEQEKKDAIATFELKRNKQQKYFLSAGLVIAIVFGYWDYRQKKRISLAKKTIEKEKLRSDELLLNILPSEVADELKAKGSAAAKHFDEVTVMFTDFKNFTLASEKLSATELVNEIHHCYSAFDKIISRHNLEKIKTIGDSYMCAGGLPVPNNTNAADTVNAALEICTFMEEEKQKRMAEGRPYFEIRIGLHSGPVVAGIVGIKKFAYDIWGDTVNIASRIESSGESGKVNISGATYELVKDKFKCIHRGKVQAKNKGEIDMYFVERSFSEG